ncbi:hypothetical protein LCGC14_1096590 [marine sediment metagenome]|uniref:Helix-turn-helix type 11 domain-containing protein n=1 Tax=marine sediment metagenome TaxID=412755 RepID=A0A0F9MYJ9_9ZZZZ
MSTINKFQMPILTPIQTRIFNELSIGKPLSRKDLVETLDTPRTTIYDNLMKLQNIKVDGVSIIWFKGRENGDGRPVWGRPVILWYIPYDILKKLNGAKKL